MALRNRQLEIEMTSQEHDARNSPRKDGTVSHRARGFSLLETMIVVSIMLIAACISFITLQPTLQQAHANAAVDQTFMWMPVSYTHLTLPTIYSV